MSKKLKRIIMALIFVPLLAFLVFFPFQMHLIINILALFASVAGALELNTFLYSKGVKINPILAAFLGVVLPLFALLTNYFPFDYTFISAMVTILIFFLLARQVFFGTKEDFEPVLLRVSGYLFLLIYPGLFLFFFVKFAGFDFPDWKMFGFLLLVYGNDSFSYIIGMAFGKNSPKPFLVSPNKSLVGFIGGSLFSILSSVMLSLILSKYFPGDLHPWIQNPWLAALLGLLMSATAILGDLFESSLKRSAKQKDSGSIILGRGGMLDSIDSVLFSIPVFYAFVEILKVLP